MRAIVLGSLLVACGLLPLPAHAQDRALLHGRVIADSSEVAISGVEISLSVPGLTVTSDSLGLFRLAGIPPGSHRVTVRKLGFLPATADLTFARGDSIDAEFVLTPVVTVLGEVAVTTTLLDRRLIGFAERRKFGIGSFLNSKELDAAPGTRLSEKLRHLPGLAVVHSRDPSKPIRIVSTRGSGSILQPSRVCEVTIFLDGVPAPDLRVNDMQPGEIAGLEWYAGASQVPPQYSGTRNGCGALLVWTR